MSIPTEFKNAELGRRLEEALALGFTGNGEGLRTLARTLDSSGLPHAPDPTREQENYTPGWLQRGVENDMLTCFDAVLGMLDTVPLDCIGSVVKMWIRGAPKTPQWSEYEASELGQYAAKQKEEGVKLLQAAARQERAETGMGIEAYASFRRHQWIEWRKTQRKPSTDC